MTHKSFTTVHDIVLYSCHYLDLSDSISQVDFTEPKVHFIILREGRLQKLHNSAAVLAHIKQEWLVFTNTLSIEQMLQNRLKIYILDQENFLSLQFLQNSVGCFYEWKNMHWCCKWTHSLVNVDVELQLKKRH